MTDEEFASFMCRPHPKIGELHFNDKNNLEKGLSFTPGAGTQTIVGRLACGSVSGERPPQVRVVGFGDDPTDYPSDWHLLSYADVPAVDLFWPAIHGEKEFHDRQTTTWMLSADGDLQANRPTPISAMTAATGPLFFALRADGVATLRRSATKLAQFASGASAALLPRLSRAHSGSTSVEVTIAEATKDSLLVEHYPGQFLQLSAGMLQFRTLGGRLSMRSLDCSLFAAGDRLTLTAAEPSDSLALVELNASWTHGPRNAFGPRGALLQRNVAASDPIAGFAVYGVGKVTVGLPTQDVATLPTPAILGSDEHLKDAPNDPRDLRGCTVLLMIDGVNERIRVHGRPQAAFAPSQEWPWEEDSLFRGSVRGIGTAMKFDMEGLLIRLRLAGGALPFTVEPCGSEGVVFLALSRRHQEVRPVGKNILRAVIEGQIGSERRVQLRVGGRHLAVPTTALLPGVNPADERTILAALGATQQSIWLTSRDGEFVAGHGADQNATLTVVPRQVINDQQRFLGVVCEGLSDGRLHWLAAAEAATFLFSGEEAEKAFSLDLMQRLKVTVLANGAVSIIGHPSAIAEVDRLRLGASTFVDCTDVNLEVPNWAVPHTFGEWQLRVCVSKQTSLTFALAADASHFERRSLRTEVAVRRDSQSGPRILLTAANERLVVSEAPPWLFTPDAPPWADEGRTFLAPSSPIECLVSVVEALDGRGELPTADELVSMTRAFLVADWVGVISGVALCAGLKARDMRGTNPVRRARLALLRNLFSRSIRSIPLEPLAIWALRPPAEVSAFTASHRRQLMELFRGGRLDAARVAAERWLSAIQLEGVKPEEEALANAFGVLIGRTGRADILVREARFLSAVTSVTRAVGVSHEVMDDTLDSTTDHLMQVAADLLDRQLDIPLLPPLQLFE
jgi:hypothetical protein